MQNDYDVVVVGGGSAGVAGAVQAARAGARTLLVEKNGALGGTMTVGAVNFPASFHAHGRQVIAGIGWEWCCRARAEEGRGEPLPPADKPHPTGCFHFGINTALAAAVADELVIEAGSDLLFHTMPAAVRREEARWAIDLCGKTGLRTVRACVVVDSTGDANATSLAGYGVKRNPHLQAATLVVGLTGYDAGAVDYDALQRAFDRAVAEGQVRRSDAGWYEGRIKPFVSRYGGNCLHVDVDARTSEEKTQAEIEARRALMRLYRFCRRQPGLEGMLISACAWECGIRETVTIRGCKEITVQDYEAGVCHDDAVCYSFYPIDSHRTESLVYRAVPPGTYPTIPLGAMLPEGGRQWIVAGRCVAGDWEANSAYRVQASCMAMGQAAGAAAALAVQRGVEIDRVPMVDLRQLLRRHAAIVPPDLAVA